MPPGSSYWIFEWFLSCLWFMLFSGFSVHKDYLPTKISFSKVGFFNSNPDVRSSGPPGHKPTLASGPSSKPSSVPGSRPLCLRCLSPNHQRRFCRNRITCWHCKQGGHVLNSCKLFLSFKSISLKVGQPLNCNFSSLIPTTS